MRMGRSQRGLRDDHLRRLRRDLLHGVRRNHQDRRKGSDLHPRRLPQHRCHRSSVQLDAESKSKLRFLYTGSLVGNC